MNDLYLETLDNGVTAVDSHYTRSRLAAAYIVKEGDRAAFVETGCHKGVPHMLAALEKLGVPRENVDYVIPTHVHLDHAGGSGGLIEALPNATLVAHPRGVKHLIDPAKLRAGTIAVYGETTFKQIHGDIVPIPEARTRAGEDGDVIDLNGRPLTIVDAPGHAYHHFAVWDEQGGSLFTGDTCGIAYREAFVGEEPFLFLTTTPTQFDPEGYHASLDRFAALNPTWLCLTHFGPLVYKSTYVDLLHRQVDAYLEIAKNASPGENRTGAIQEALADLFMERLRGMGSPLTREEMVALHEMDLELNAQGLEVWLRKREKAAASNG